METYHTRWEMRAVMGLLIMGVLVFGGCDFLNTSGNGGRDDKGIIQDIQARLYRDAQLKQRDIHVDAQRGVVVLTGSVASDQERSSAEAIAKAAQGVKQVMDELSVTSETDSANAQPPSVTQTEPAQGEPERKAAAAHRRETRPKHPAIRQDTDTAESGNGQYAQPLPTEVPSAQGSAQQAAAAPPPAPPAPSPPPPPLQLTIPAGTVISVRLTDTVDSARNSAGEEFGATVSNPVMVDGHLVIPQDAEARVRLVQSAAAGHMKGQSMLELELAAIIANGTTYDVTSSYYTVRGQSRGKRTAETVGGGAALGAIIGAIAGGGKGAAIGSAVGAGAGEGYRRPRKHNK